MFPFSCCRPGDAGERAPSRWLGTFSGHLAAGWAALAVIPLA